MTTSIIATSTYLSLLAILVSFSFSIIYSTTRFFHFAHAVVFTSGAYFSFLFFKILGIPIALSIPFAIICSILLGCLIEFSIYRPLRKKQASSMVLLLSSLGLYIFLQNMVSMFFGDDTKSIRTGEVKEGLKFFDARITPIQITTIVVAITVTILIILFYKYTQLGKAMNAVSSDKELAEYAGINTDRVILWSFAIGSGLAALAGILVALDVDMTPTMGMNALLLGVVVMIIGGNNIKGMVLAALLLSFAQNFGVWYISSQWKDSIAFIILVLFLLFKPEGFFGKKIRKQTV